MSGIGLQTEFDLSGSIAVVTGVNSDVVFKLSLVEPSDLVGVRFLGFESLIDIRERFHIGHSQSTECRASDVHMEWVRIVGRTVVGVLNLGR